MDRKIIQYMEREREKRKNKTMRMIERRDLIQKIRSISQVSIVERLVVGESSRPMSDL